MSKELKASFKIGDFEYEPSWGDYEWFNDVPVHYFDVSKRGRWLGKYRIITKNITREGVSDAFEDYMATCNLTLDELNQYAAPTRATTIHMRSPYA